MSDTQTIKDRVDIVQFISEYVPLKKAGVNWKACCPFHGEKTPSFMVNAERQFWHCFGCGKSGDIFSFLQEMEGVEFPEALKILAERAGVEIKHFKSDIDKGKKNRIYEVNAKAAYFYHQFLLTMPAAQSARDYLRDRGVSEESIKKWQIGFIPEQWDLLTKYLLKNNFTVDDLLLAGLVVKNENRRSFYDVFRGRVMFPIKDIYGNIIGFTGRILVETEHSGGKYVNTSQTPVFDKSRAVYGLDLAKMEIKNKDEIILVEGQMDVIANHAIGLTQAVAASGTALTEGHLQLLKRYSQNILFAFDADEAGIKAAKRGIDIAVGLGMNVKIITLPPDAGKDADECIQKSPEMWRQAVSQAQGVMSWYFSLIFGKYDNNNPRDRQKIAEELVTEIEKIPKLIEKDTWYKKLADKLGSDINTLKDIAKTLKKPVNLYHRENPTEKTEDVGVAETLWDKLLSAFWAYIIYQPKLFFDLYENIKPEYFVDTPYISLYDWGQKRYNNKEELKFIGLPQAGQNQADLLFLQGEKVLDGLSDKEIKDSVEQLLKRIRSEWVKKQKENLNFELNRAREAGDKQKEDEILNLIIKLNLT